MNEFTCKNATDLLHSWTCSFVWLQAGDPSCSWSCFWKLIRSFQVLVLRLIALSYVSSHCLRRNSLIAISPNSRTNFAWWFSQMRNRRFQMLTSLRLISTRLSQLTILCATSMPMQSCTTRLSYSSHAALSLASADGKFNLAFAISAKEWSTKWHLDHSDIFAELRSGNWCATVRLCAWAKMATVSIKN